MQNLYDLLGVRPDDDAETLKKAFRKAAKASHPDHHGGDPQAAARFRQIFQAYEILSDADRRTVYDRLLESELKPLRYKLKRCLSDMKRHVGHGLITGALLAIVLAGGYKLYDRVPKMPSDGAAGVAAHQSASAAAGTAERNRAERVAAPQMPLVPLAISTTPGGATSAANDHDQEAKAYGEPASNPTEEAIAVASRHNESSVPTDAGVLGKTKDEAAVRHDPPSLEAPSFAGEERNSIAAADDSRDGKVREPGGANTGDVRPPERKMSARVAAMTKRHTPSRRPIEQAALVEGTNAPAPDSSPARVFGVGF